MEKDRKYSMRAFTNPFLTSQVVGEKRKLSIHAAVSSRIFLSCAPKFSPMLLPITSEPSRSIWLFLVILNQNEKISISRQRASSIDLPFPLVFNSISIAINHRDLKSNSSILREMESFQLSFVKITKLP